MEQPATENSGIIKTITIVGDFILLNLSMMLAFFILKGIEAQTVPFFPLKICLLISNLCYVPCISIFGVILYDRFVRPERIVGRVLSTIILHAFLLFFVLSIIEINVFSFFWFPGFYVLFIPATIIWRLILRLLVRLNRMSGKDLRATVLVGEGDNMLELYRTLSNLTYGYRVAGVFCDKQENNYREDIPYVGTVDQIFDWLPHHAIHEVYCGLPFEQKDDILAIMNYCDNHLIRFYSVPHVRNYIKRRLQMDLVGEVPVLSVRIEPLQKLGNRILKRAFDVIASTLFLCILFPFIYVIVGILIKATSKGPVFFKQYRNGENGKIFTCYKFRSMKVNTQADTLQATKDDPRKTRFGDFLRRTNIDELPQFINVWKGEMSVVGPRPHMLKHTEEYSHLINKYMMRHLVKPGITGWAQVTGFRGETKELSQMEGRVRQDLWYIENWTFMLDLHIIILTVVNMFRGEKNAY